MPRCIPSYTCQFDPQSPDSPGKKTDIVAPDDALLRRSDKGLLTRKMRMPLPGRLRHNMDHFLCILYCLCAHLDHLIS
jgi:hypothetical protein